MRRPPLVPDIAEQSAIARQVGRGADGPVLRGGVRLDLGSPERLVGRSLADGKDERVCDGPHQLPIPITVAGLAGPSGGRFGGHGVPFLKGTAYGAARGYG
jgi:hypothetical protein